MWCLRVGFGLVVSNLVSHRCLCGRSQIVMTLFRLLVPKVDFDMLCTNSHVLNSLNLGFYKSFPSYFEINLTSAASRVSTTLATLATTCPSSGKRAVS